MKVRIELNGSGIRELLASSDVQRDLDKRGEAVAAAAVSRGIMVGAPFSDDDDAVPLPIEVKQAGSSKRARVIVVADHYAGLAVESKHRLLVSSLDAARF